MTKHQRNIENNALGAQHSKAQPSKAKPSAREELENFVRAHGLNSVLKKNGDKKPLRLDAENEEVIESLNQDFLY